MFVVVDELSYPLHGVVEHGPSLGVGWCADGDAGVRCDMWAILSIQCDMQPLE